MSEIWFRTGEATVFASEGQVTDAMPEVVIGSVKGPVGTAFATLMGQSAGHTRMFILRDCNQQVRPSAIMTSKVTITSAEYVDLLGGVVQAALGDAIVDAVANGIIPKEQANDLAIITTVWLDPRTATDANLDKKELYKNNYEAMTTALSRAMKQEPTMDELIANRKTVRHFALADVQID
ncbi:formaldehyde-activating enzyme [Hyphomicrobium sp. D-2]|uniref:formaldehyde-activating enzyme n=1 Tax=Hyphomicrobium sp. D-2 TaxID=3041621 RepID=UPI0024564383|nr:formaldehyde-activating enzyme [Hyphomicrobium sp. D-2]MDH4981823.1 formaldehyde-activating enzyme [Hyphomicrobium sp. D-2]